MKHSEPTENQCFIALIMGSLFTLLGIGVLFLSEGSWKGILAGICIAGFGVEAIVRARQKKHPLLFKIGPLP